MDTDKVIARLAELLDQYNQTSNRMVLTIIKQLYTKLVKQNHFTEYRLERLFEAHRTSLSILNQR